MKVAFLDRDGVINKDPGYLYKIEDFEFTDGCIEALKLLLEKGYSLIVITNQSGIGRGYYSEQNYQKLTDWYREQLLREGIFITDIFYCPHAPEEQCNCRKPGPGLFLQAAKKYPVDFKKSLMVGDKLSDLEAASKVGIPQLILVGNERLDESKLLDKNLLGKIIKKYSLLEFSKSL